MLKERVDGPEDEVPSRIRLVKRPLSWPQARSGVLLKGVLARRGDNRGGCKEGPEVGPPTHTTPSES